MMPNLLESYNIYEEFLSKYKEYKIPQHAVTGQYN